MPPAKMLILSPAWRIACTVLNIVPIPGVGAIIAGWRNPHSPLRRQGIQQALLVIFGSYPLIIPGAIGLLWACWSAYTIHRDARPAPEWSRQVPVGDD